MSIPTDKPIKEVKYNNTTIPISAGNPMIEAVAVAIPNVALTVFDNVEALTSAIQNVALTVFDNVEAIIETE